MQHSVTSQHDFAERPAVGIRRSLLAVAASGVILLFFLVFGLLAASITAIMMVQAVMVLVAARLGLWGFVLEWMRAQDRLLRALLKAVWPARDAGHTVSLAREDAPELHTLAAETAAHVGAPAPSLIELSIQNNAAAVLPSFLPLKGRWTIVVGYDLLHTLSVTELKAILAHEVAHSLLVRRGFSWWLAVGAGAMSRAAEAARVQVEASALTTGRRFYTAELALWLFRRIALAGTQLVAACFRQDEFEADALAASVVGPELYARVLLRTHVGAVLSSRLTWQQRAARRHESGGFSLWLQQRLAPADDRERHALEQQAIREDTRSRFSTHPSLSDRLAMLQERGASSEFQTEDHRRACRLLLDPDDAADRLFDALARIIADAERADTRRQQRQYRREPAGESQARDRGFGIGGLLILSLITAFLVADSVADPARASWMILPVIWLPALVVWLLYALTRPRCPREWPLPPFGPLHDRWLQRDQITADGEAQGSPAVAVPPSVQKTRDLRRHWAAAAWNALSDADYAQALAAVQQVSHPKLESYETLSALLVAAGYHHNGHAFDYAAARLTEKYYTCGSLPWVFGWAFTLLGQWHTAEVYLLEALRRQPSAPTVRAMLALCQWKRGKYQAALAQMRSLDSSESCSTAHRLLSAQILLAAGQSRDAEEQLALIDEREGRRPEIILTRIQISYARGLREAARCYAHQLEQARPGPRTWLDYAACAADAGDFEEASRGYNLALHVGHYPEALLGLAQIARDSGERAAARAHLEAALDVRRGAAPDGRNTLELLGPLFTTWTALEPLLDVCSAWRAVLEIPVEHGTAVLLRLLLVASSREDAAARATQLRQVMTGTPGTPISVELGASHEQPTGPSHRGIAGWQLVVAGQG